MGKYDELLAKSLETGDFKQLGAFVFYGAEDIEKSHVKAHFRRDKNGKLLFIKDYDDARHKNEVEHSIESGKKYRINNPKSKHHGKEFIASRYHEQNEKSGKAEYVAGTVDGQRSDLKPHHLEPVEDAKPDAKEARKPDHPPAHGPDLTPASPFTRSDGRKPERTPMQQLERTGTAHKGDVSVKVVEHPAGGGYGVETTVKGDRRYPTEDPMPMEEALKFAVKQLDSPRPAPTAKDGPKGLPPIKDGKYDLSGYSDDDLKALGKNAMDPKKLSDKDLVRMVHITGGFGSKSDDKKDGDQKPAANFDDTLKTFLKGAQEKMNDYYAQHFPNLKPDTLEIQDGKRYARIIKKTPGSTTGSAWAFIDKTNGDILKPASWKAPAKHARGNILTGKNSGIDAVGPNGPAYLK